MGLQQRYLEEYFNRVIKFNKLPHFIILSGDRGSGKSRLISSVSARSGLTYVEVGSTIAELRDVRKTALKAGVQTMFCIQHGESMSAPAQNSILKITEECPENVYICLETDDYNAVLPTLISRATLLFMEPYSTADIEEYAQESLYATICRTPGEVNLLKASGGVQQLHDYAEKVIDNIASVSGSNSFKIAEPIALKNEEDKIDLVLFWRAFNRMCLSRATSNPNTDSSTKYCKGVLITSNYLNDLRVKSMNKSIAFDCWILDIRKAWV